MANNNPPNKLCNLIVEHPSNNLQRFRFRIKDDGIDHRNNFDKGGKRIIIWHHIVDRVLVKRHLSRSFDEWSPYFFLEKQSKMSCVIGRVFRTDFNPSIADDHFNVGMESQNASEELHICVSMPGNEVIKEISDPNDPSKKIKVPNFPVGKENMYTPTSPPRPWTIEANFKIQGESGGDEVRFTYRILDSIDATGVPYVPVWYFYTNANDPDKYPIVSLEDSPVINWPALRAYYENNKNALPEGQALIDALRAAGLYVMLRYHRCVSPQGSGTRESDVGQSSPGGPPSGGS